MVTKFSDFAKQSSVSNKIWQKRKAPPRIDRGEALQLRLWISEKII